MVKKKGLWANIHAKRKRGEKPAKPGDKDYPETLNIMKKGGKTKDGFKPHMMYGDGKSKKTNTYEEHMSLKKKGWGHSKPAKQGGKMKGPSHKDGGIDINVEGGEIVINKTINDAAGKHEKNLLALNKNPKNYKIVKEHDYPVFDARKRGK